MIPTSIDDDLWGAHLFFEYMNRGCDCASMADEVFDWLVDFCYASGMISMVETMNMKREDVYNGLWFAPKRYIIDTLIMIMRYKIPGLTDHNIALRCTNAWPVIYSMKWDDVYDVTGFRKASSNCLFAKLNFMHKNYSLPFFIKIVPVKSVMRGEVDNPLIDSVNGKILHLLIGSIPNDATQKKIREHTIMYETSFNSIIKANGTLPLKEMTNMHSPTCPFSVTFDDRQDSVFASIFEYIPGVSVMDLMKDDNIPDGRELMIGLLPEFWETMSILGMNYGMLHNDMHSGNVFYNYTLGKLVLIDYGRMTFPDDIQQALGGTTTFDDLTEQETMRNGMNAITYKQLIGTNNVAYIAGSHFYTTHMLDMATFMTNVYFYISMKMDDKWHFFKNLISFDKQGKTIKINMRIRDSLMEWYNACLSVNNATFLNQEQKQGMLLIGEGIFFMCLIMQNVIRGKIMLTPGMRALHIPRVDLDRLRILHFGFQVGTNILQQYVNTTLICKEVLDELTELRNMSQSHAPMISYLFNNTLFLKKMKTPNPGNRQSGGNKKMSNMRAEREEHSTETSVQEWVRRYKYLTDKDRRDDTSLQSLASKDRVRLSIISKEKSETSLERENIQHPIHSALSLQASQQPVLAYGGEKPKRTRKPAKKQS